MIYVPIQKFAPGMVLAKDVYCSTIDSACHILLKKGQVLREQTIDRLNYRKIGGAYIVNEFTDDIKEDCTFDEKTKIKSLNTIRKTFTMFEQNRGILTQEQTGQLQDVANTITDLFLEKSDFMVNLMSIRTHDDTTFNHCLGVATIAAAMGIELGFTKEQVGEITMAALLHDFGNVMIPNYILETKGPVTAEDFAIIKKHPFDAFHSMSLKNNISANVCDGIISHHERFNGTGYPYALEGKNIPLYGRILAIADVYDAMTAHRPYRIAHFPSEAIEYILGNSDVLFDADLVKVFMKKIAPYPVGICVKLSNGKSGIVFRVYHEQPLRPVVRLLDIEHTTLDLFHDENLRDVTVVGVGYDEIFN